MKFDWELIVSSFAQQYGIRLYYEYETISCEEFRQLLTGLNGDTPLGYVVGIRAEKDPKRIKKLTAQEKKIRSDWAKFKAQNGEMKIKELNRDEISKTLSKIFS